ncbi:MAG: sugar ABC transporter substrate-binding protein [Caldilineaceae bacterium]|jgi:ribose transport system substrate-binding protein
MRISKLLLLFTLLVTLAACVPVQPAATGGDAAASSDAITVAVVTPYLANATTKYVIDRFQAEGTAKGWNVTVTDTNADFNELVNRIDNAVTQGVDAIVLGMGDPAQMTKGLESAAAAGIPVFGLDAGVADNVALNITSDNGQLGKETAHQLAEAIGGKGNVVMFTHDPHPGVRARAEAAAAEFANYPDITVIEKKHIEVPGPVDFARTLTQDLLTANPDAGSIAGIWAGWDEPALGAVQAIEAAGRAEILVVGIDGTDFAKAEIAKGGPFNASIAQDFDGMAAQLAGIVEEYLNGTQPDSNLVTIPGILITAENAK